MSQNQAWAQRLAELSDLRALAGAVNAPGNDVFDSRDVDAEVRRVNVALESFNRQVGVLRADYDQLPAREGTRLTERVTEVSTAMRRMTDEADQIFGLFRNHEADSAGKRMATMDRAYASVNGALARAEAEVRDIQAARLEEQAGDAAWLRRIEYVIALLVLGMIGGVMVYGHAMSTALKRASEEREQHVSALQASEARTRAIVQSAKDGIFTVDERGILQSANPALARLVGTPADALIGRPLDVLMPALRGAEADSVRDALLDGADVRPSSANAWTVLTSAGEARRIELSVAEIPSESGRLFSAVMHDVTAPHQLAESLDRARQAAEDASLAKSTFLANMSHELRTPLNAIIGYSEMLHETAEERDDRELADDLTCIRVSGRHLLDLISNILDLSKIEAGKVTLHREAVDLRNLIAEVEATARPLAAQQHNTLTVVCDDDLPILWTDALKVRQLLLNLVGNACKFTNNGPVRIVAMRTAGQSDGVTFVVSDSGIGMTDEQIGRLFKPFAQADPSTTRKFGGTGLGLALAKRFAELLGGDVSVTSQPGVGSEFTVCLRSVADEPSVVPARLTAESQSERNVPLAGSSLSGYVLVVEDDAMAQEMLTRQLAKVGLRSKVAATAGDALRMCRADRPAAITLDLMLPDIHGLAVLGLLKNDPALRAIPVIVVSILDDRMSGYAIGATEYLVKPVDGDQLTRALTRVLPARESGHVLVVDDDGDARAMMARRLHTTGIRVEVACNGREALDAIRVERPSLILLDLMMPEMDGFEVLEHLAGDATLRDIPVVVVTARDMADTDILRFNRSVVDLVRKQPAHVDEVLESVSQLALAHVAAARKPRSTSLLRVPSELPLGQKARRPVRQSPREATMHKVWLSVAAATCAIGVMRGVAQTAVPSSIPQPTLHHIHLNSVDPDRSIAWYTDYWPKGRKATFGGFPAFVDEKGFYLLYTKVPRQAPGGFDRKAQRSVPQSAFWTFGSTFAGPDTSAFRARVGKLDPKAFELVTLFGGPEGKQTATHALALPLGDQLATATTIKQQQAQREKEGKPAPTSGLDFGYVVDPDGMLVEVTAGKADGFREHTHFWGENPLCSANWHVEHLGATFPAAQNSFSTSFTFENGRWNPCAVPTGEITFPTYMSVGQLRIPAGNARVADASWLWYPRQCRNGRCGAGADQPLAKSRGQVVDHIGLSYPSLDPVLAHLKAAKIPILEGPYKFGDTRAVLIEDLDGLAFELIELKK